MYLLEIGVKAITIVINKLQIFVIKIYWTISKKMKPYIDDNNNNNDEKNSELINTKRSSNKLRAQRVSYKQSKKKNSSKERSVNIKKNKKLEGKNQRYY